MAEQHERRFVDWVKQKAADVKDENCYESKSWLLTGASIYPNNISMKMMCYRMAKQDKNIGLSTNHLTSMLNSSSSDSHEELQNEVKTLLKAVQSDVSTSPEDKLDADIFRNLHKDLQCKILKKLSSECQDVLMKCSLLLLLIKINHSHARDCGLMLIENLFQAEINESPNNIRNVYRKYFVSDVLPLILQDNSVGTDKKVMLSWLDKAFQYYVVTAFQASKEGIMSAACKAAAGSTIKESRPWESLASLLILMSQQIKLWGVNADHFKSEENLVQYLVSLQARLAKDYSKTLKREFVYIGTYHLLKLIHSYNSLTRKHKPTCLIQRNLVGIKSSPRKGKKAAAAVTSSETPTVSVAGSIQNGDSLLSTFQSACSVWSLLHSDTAYSKGFDEFLDRLDYAKWRFNLANFNRDRIVFQKEYKDYPIVADTSSEFGCYRLQKACCQFALGMHLEACKEVIAVITKESAHTEKTCTCHQSSDSSSPGDAPFMFISHSNDVFDCGINILMSALKGCLHIDPTNGTIIGDLCVLCQLNWPKHKDLFFKQLKSQVTSEASFKYPCFFDYITNTEILEEFAYLSTEQGGNVNLQILAMNAPKQRTVTRGVSRFAQEDFKAAFEKQMLRSTECIQGLVIRFLDERRDEMLRPLS